ncbi:DNA replication origin-binding helicase [Equid alphaherpesvirus 3]|uniref:Replication origin-binding protein n=1 Tax=Equid alphaherpesvirus 3 TaxID=80341 RepID=A0A077B617_9ALPH|nr:DNA replication origin-binding helicase [Equid alphaherpesvirus 3]AIL02970.1 DNA replication origin-binding helicase [Equid alphaherpesvirus 3]
MLSMEPSPAAPGTCSSGRVAADFVRAMPPDRRLQPLSSRAEGLASSTFEDSYTSSVSLAKMLYGGDLEAWVRRARPGVSLEVQSDAPVTFPRPRDPTSRRVTVVRAPMGSGKTTALLKWLGDALDAPNISALVISCRRSFTRTLARRFNDAELPGFATYFTSTEYTMAGEPFRRLLVQIESLHRVDENLLNNYDILVLDEVMSTLGQLYSPTMVHLGRVDALLARLLRTCPQIIAMDATANAQLVDYLAACRGERNVHVIINSFAAPGFSLRQGLLMRSLGADVLRAALGLVWTENESGAKSMEADPRPLAERLSGVPANGFFGRLMERLRAGHNVCVFSSTVTFSEIVARFCAQFTNSILVLNSLRPSEDVAAWGTVRVLIYTTVVTVGLSFDHSHFHSMFAYVKPMNYGPDMVSVYQSLGRVRELIANELFAYVDSSGARPEPIFTPMLLNHVVSCQGGWPAEFSQVTNALCCQFRARCGPAYQTAARGLALFAKFKYKHFFERCTLASVGDSINILHTLLESNRVRLSLDGCPTPLTAADFCTFLRDLRLDAYAARRDIRQLREPGPPAATTTEILESDEVALFIHKYLLADVACEDIRGLLAELHSPVVREQFVNVAVLGACLRLPAALASPEVFAAVYRHYASGTVPVISETGALESVSIAPDVNVLARWDLYKSCARQARTLGWDPARGGSASDVSEEDVAGTLGEDYARCQDLLIEIAKCNVTPLEMLASGPVRGVTTALAGRPRTRVPLSRGEHALSLFKVLWEDVFGARLTKSTQTFPGGVRVKNLRKEEIVGLLEAAGVNHSECKTHRELYSLLMGNRKLFTGTRYKLRAPKWSRNLCFLPSEKTLTCGTLLDAALADLSPEAWPQAQGALDFAAL